MIVQRNDAGDVVSSSRPELPWLPAWSGKANWTQNRTQPSLHQTGDQGCHFGIRSVREYTNCFLVVVYRPEGTIKEDQGGNCPSWLGLFFCLWHNALLPPINQLSLLKLRTRGPVAEHDSPFGKSSSVLAELQLAGCDSGYLLESSAREIRDSCFRPRIR